MSRMVVIQFGSTDAVCKKGYDAYSLRYAELMWVLDCEYPWEPDDSCQFVATFPEELLR